MAHEDHGETRNTFKQMPYLQDLREIPFGRWVARNCGVELSSAAGLAGSLGRRCACGPIALILKPARGGQTPAFTGHCVWGGRNLGR